MDPEGEVVNVWTVFIYTEKGTNLVFFRMQEYNSEFRKIRGGSTQDGWLFTPQGLVEYVYNRMIISVSYFYFSRFP